MPSPDRPVSPTGTEPTRRIGHGEPHRKPDRASADHGKAPLLATLRRADSRATRRASGDMPPVSPFLYPPSCTPQMPPGGIPWKTTSFKPLKPQGLCCRARPGRGKWLPDPRLPQAAREDGGHVPASDRLSGDHSVVLANGGHGLKIVTPRPTKSLTLRVTRVRRCSSAVAAI